MSDDRREKHHKSLKGMYVAKAELKCSFSLSHRYACVQATRTRDRLMGRSTP